MKLLSYILSLAAIAATGVIASPVPHPAITALVQRDAAAPGIQVRHADVENAKRDHSFLDFDDSDEEDEEKKKRVKRGGSFLDFDDEDNEDQI